MTPVATARYQELANYVIKRVEEFAKAYRTKAYDVPRLALLALRIGPAVPGQPSRRIEGESPQRRDVHTV
jgi:hypothetical protein